MKLFASYILMFRSLCQTMSMQKCKIHRFSHKNKTEEKIFKCSFTEIIKLLTKQQHVQAPNHNQPTNLYTAQHMLNSIPPMESLIFYHNKINGSSNHCNKFVILSECAQY